MDELAGFIAEFQEREVRYSDISGFGSVREDAVELSVRHRRLCHIEVVVARYDDDPRSLYEVAEVRRWIRAVLSAWPDALFWLTPMAQWVFLLGLHPEMWTRDAGGLLTIAIDVEQLIPGIAASFAAGALVLEEGGMGESDVAEAQPRGAGHARGHRPHAHRTARGVRLDAEEPQPRAHRTNDRDHARR